MKPSRFAQPVTDVRQSQRPYPLDITIARNGPCSIGAKQFDLEMGEGSIRDHNRDFIALMGEVEKQIFHTGSLALSPTFFSNMLQELRDIGLSAYHSLGEEMDEHLRGYHTRDSGAGLRITIKADVYPLLWEFLYVGSAIGPVDPRLFWGYRHHVARFIGSDILPIEIDPVGGFLFCRNHLLQHWADEMQALHEVAPHLPLILLDDCLDTLDPDHAEWNLGDRMLYTCTTGNYGFIHIASHLYPDPRDQSVLGALLALSYREQKVEIKLKRLNALRNDLHFTQNPLVFLNACQTMTNPEHLSQGESFPRSFLKLGAGAVIATACNIPDQFAAAFACKFYEIFLGKQTVTASDALRLARQYFMDKYNNPLGLAYGLYAHNDLMIYE